MVKILFIVPSLQFGGLENAQINLANALVEYGYDVTVMTYGPEKDLLERLNRRVRYIYKPLKPHKFMKRIPYIRHKFYDDGMWETRASAKTLYGYYVGNEEYDVEIAYFRGLAIKIISGSTNTHSTKLAFVHSDFEKCVGITSNFRNMVDTVKAYSRFDRIVCVSEKVRESFNKIIGYSEKTITINNIIPIDNITLLSKEAIDIKKNGFTVITVGHIIPLKGHKRLIDAVERLHDEGFDISLWIVGDGVCRGELEDYTKDYEYIRFLGMQSNPYKIISKADVYVCSSFYEGFPLTVCEAIICGTPVLSTECAGSSEILGNGEYGMITENSEDGLYEGIKKMLTDTSLLRKYREKLPDRISYFDKDSIVKKITCLF